VGFGFLDLLLCDGIRPPLHKHRQTQEKTDTRKDRHKHREKQEQTASQTSVQRQCNNNRQHLKRQCPVLHLLFRVLFFILLSMRPFSADLRILILKSQCPTIVIVCELTMQN